MSYNWGINSTGKLPPVEHEQPPQLFKKSKATDITLLVEGKELHFAKYPLTEGSDVFTHMIANSADQSRLQLDDVAYKDMIMFLECLHPKMLRLITETNFEPVATIAQKFKHEGVLNRCEEYIIQQFSLQGNPPDGMYPKFFFHLNLAEKYGLENALQVGVSSRRVKKAYFSNLERKSLVFLQNTNGQNWKRYEDYGQIRKGYEDDENTNGQIRKGYEDDDSFQSLSFKTKFYMLSTRLKIAEAVIDKKDPYLEKNSKLF